MLEKYQLFCNQNPFEFRKEQLEKIKEDIIKPRNGIVCDEYVDFILWTKGLKSRQEYFADFVEKILPVGTYTKLLEVGAGETARLSKLLTRKGYVMTAMDPLLRETGKDNQMPDNLEHSLEDSMDTNMQNNQENLTENNLEHITEDTLEHVTEADIQSRNNPVTYRKETFIVGKTDITGYDAIVAQEPCDATEHIIRECVAQQKDFVISLCGVQHRLINGEMPKDVYQWYDYLENIGGEYCILVPSKMIPGYRSNVLLGKLKGRSIVFRQNDGG